MEKLEENSSSLQVVGAILGYSLCSSTLLLANKMAMVYLPSPSVVSFIQIVFATAAVVGLKLFGYQIDWFEWEKVKPYSLYVVIFVVTIYTNMQALSHSNVETVIVFRACSPIAVGIIEYLFMDRLPPSTRSMASLVLVLAGALLYCYSELSSQHSMSQSSYFWSIAYLIFITIEMTYGKVLTSSVKMDSVWGPVLYCNALSILPMFLLTVYAGDINGETLELISQMPITGVLTLTFSCVVGTLIGYTGWLCRGMVSATSFTLVGVVNKFLTVLLNVFMWDKHSTPLGLLAVCVCLISGSFYQQSPKRESAPSEPVKVQPVAQRQIQVEEEEEEEYLMPGKSPADMSLEELEREYERAIKL